MKYVNRLTDEELTELFKLFLVDNEEYVSLTITRYNNDISLFGIVTIHDCENPNKIYEVEDSYELSDYNVRVYSHSGDVTKVYREYMYNKFGNEYAKDFLLG